MTCSARVVIFGLLLWSVVAQATSARVALRWKAVDGATEYEVQIAKDPAFHDVVVETRSKVAGYRWGELPNVPYYWRVRSFDKDGRASDWSRAERIDPAVGRPELKDPANGARLSLGSAAVEVSLSAVPSPVFRAFSFEVSRDPAFTHPVAYPSGPEAQVRARVDATGTWYWRVTATDLSGRAGEPSEMRSFEVNEGPPSPDVSGSTATVVWSDPAPKATLRWSSRHPLSLYTVEITSEDHARQTLDASGSEVAFVPSGPGIYQWRVRGIDAQGKPTPFGETATLTVQLAPPELRAPADGARVLAKLDADPTVTFAWTVPFGAGVVRFELASDDAFSQVLFSQELTGVEATLPIASRGRLFWRLTALDGDGHLSEPTKARGLTVETLVAPAVPTPIAPAAEAILPLAPDDQGRVPFQWSAVDGARKYQVQVDDEPVEAQTRVSERPILEPTVLPPGEHTWRVRAFGEEDVASAWSEPLRFDVGPPRAVKARIEVATPQLPADGRASTELRITLFDSRGREISGVDPVLSVSAGELSATGESGAGHRAKFVSPEEVPEGGVAQVVVTDRGFQTTTPIHLVPSPATVLVGARLGWNGVISSLSSPRLELEAQWRTPWLRHRLWLGARVSGYQGSGELAADRIRDPVAWSTQVIPVAATAVYRLPTRWVDFYGGALVSLNLVRFTQTQRDAELAVSPGFGALLGASRRAGPGRISAELGASVASARGELAEGRVGGLFFTVGYGVEL